MYQPDTVGMDYTALVVTAVMKSCVHHPVQFGSMLSVSWLILCWQASCLYTIHLYPYLYIMMR